MLTKSDEGNVIKLELVKSTKEKEVYSYLNNKGEKLWMFRHKYHDGLTGKRKEKKKSGFKTEKAAIQALFEVKAQTLRGETKLIENDNITISQWLDTWLEMNKNKWKVTTMKQRELTVKNHLKPLLGHFKLQKLDRITYQKVFIDKIEQKFKPGTVNLFHSIFKIAINAAVEEELLARIDFKNNTITIERTRDEKGTRTPKTKNSYRKILVDNLVIDQLKKYQIWCKQILLKHGKSFDDQLFIFITEFNNPLHAMAIHKLFRYTMFKAGILNDDGEPKITFHGLRHTHATILLNGGQNVKVIAERLGNTPAMIYQIYGHVMKELEEQTMEVFSKSLEIGTGAKSGAN